MNYDEILVFMNQYGLFFLFGVVLLEYLNLPGFPAGVIYPAAGLWLSTTDIPFILALGVSLPAAMLGSLCIYGAGRLGGPPLLAKIRKKSLRTGEKIDRYTDKMLKHAGLTLFVGKQVPLIRTLIDLPAGALRVRLPNYLLFTALGILLFNSLYMLAGYFFGHIIFAS